MSMTESEAIKICNTIVFATSFSNPKGVPLNTTKEELTEAMRMSIQALEKQIPKKPVNYDKHYYKCPCCNEDLGIDNDMLFVYDEEPPKFCIKCGQKLDWSDEE